MIPYAAHSVEDADESAILRALHSDRLTQGPEVPRFEESLSASVAVDHAVAVSSGTAALHVALAALGVGPGDEVIVPSLTFVATSNAVLLCGARPVFADIEPETLTLCAESTARCMTERTRGVIPMHFAGHPADVDALREVVGDGRFVLEDGCHALGAKLRGRPVGSLGDAACFSFHPAKLVTTGEGGAITTHSAELACRARRLREHGIERIPSRFEGLGVPAEIAEEDSAPWIYEMHELAPNYRLPELSAALGRSQLARMDSLCQRRLEIADGYAKALSDLAELELPQVRSDASSAWHLYVVRIHRELLACSRRAFFERLRARGIGVQVHYIPVHLQPYYRHTLKTHFGMLPVTEREYLRSITLPLFPAMTDVDVERVVDVVREEIKRCRR
jgi:perosamine synthetase